MATVTTEVDDLDVHDDGGETAKASVATQSRRMLDSDGYVRVIHLNDEHAGEFDEEMARYLEAASEKVGFAQIVESPPAPARRRSASSGSSSSTDRDRNRAIRTWAREQGAEISDRGTMPREVSESYDSGDVDRLLRWDAARKADRAAADAQG